MRAPKRVRIAGQDEESVGTGSQHDDGNRRCPSNKRGARGKMASVAMAAAIVIELKSTVWPAVRRTVARGCLDRAVSARTSSRKRGHDEEAEVDGRGPNPKGNHEVEGVKTERG